MSAGGRFACPADCGWCCTHLERETSAQEARALRAFRRELQAVGVYTCGDPATRGLSLSTAEAEALREEARARNLRIQLHARTFLLETRRRLAVILDWHLAHVSCPFHEGAACTVYEKRPLVCRAFPVLAPAPRWALAPSCPLSGPALGAAETRLLRLGTHFASESRARRRLDRAGEALDEAAMRALDSPGVRFAKGLGSREARARAQRYRPLSLEAFLLAYAP